MKLTQVVPAMVDCGVLAKQKMNLRVRLSMSCFFLLVLAGWISGAYVYGWSQGGESISDPDWVFIPAGVFEMGSSEKDIEIAMKAFAIGRRGLFASEVPRHEVRMDSFWMSRHLVTNAQFKVFIEQNVEWRRGRIKESRHNGRYLEHWGEEGPAAGLEDVPVVNVSWYAAEAYCRWQGGHLPTEAQWEWAARGGLDRSRFPWGDEMPDNGRANWHENGIDHPVAVGQYPPNDYGLYDMAGNAWEFCLDEWQEDFYSRSPLDNPLAGAETPDFDFLGVSTRRVVRGGSWGAAAVNMRVTYRDSHPVRDAGDHVGFRCVRPSEQSGD